MVFDVFKSSKPPSKRRKLYLHIGMHKTATTTLQTTFAANPEILKQNGIIYPTTGTINHHHYAIAIATAKTDKMRERLFGDMGNADKQLVKKIAHAGFISELLFEINGKPQYDLLISSEAFCQFDQASIRNFSKIFRDFDIIPLLVVRKHSEWIQSYFYTHVTYSKGTWPIDTIGIPFNISDIAEDWAKVSATGRTKVVSYELLRDSPESIPALLIRIATDNPAIASDLKSATNHNTSTSPMAIVLCQELRKLGASDSEITEFMETIESLAPAEAQSLLDPAAIERFDDQYNEEIGRLRSSPLIDGYFTEPSAHLSPDTRVINNLCSAILAMGRAVQKLRVTSRKVVWLLLEQLRLDFVPVLHRLQGRPAAQG